MRLAASHHIAAERFSLWGSPLRHAGRGVWHLLVLVTLASASLGAQAPAPTSADAPRPADETREARLARADRARIRGRADATVWIVVISDYQCPFCKRWHDETEPLIDRDYIRTGDRKSTRLNSSHGYQSRMPSSA